LARIKRSNGVLKSPCGYQPVNAITIFERHGSSHALGRPQVAHDLRRSIVWRGVPGFWDGSPWEHCIRLVWCSRDRPSPLYAGDHHVFSRLHSMVDSREDRLFNEQPAKSPCSILPLVLTRLKSSRATSPLSGGLDSVGSRLAKHENLLEDELDCVTTRNDDFGA